MTKVACFVCVFLILISCSKQVLSPLDPEDEFERAMSFFENRKHNDAVLAFQRIIFYHPSSEYVDDAQFWLARTYFEKRDYAQAIGEFDYLIRNFSTSPLLEEAFLYRAKSYLLQAPSYYKDQTETKHAISLLDEFLTKFPNSQYTNDIKDLILSARNRLAKKEVENGKLYLKLNEPDAALLYFEYVIETYPETRVSGEAKYYAALIYEKKGESEEALRLYNELLEDEEWREMVLKKIAVLKVEEGETKAEETEKN